MDEMTNTSITNVADQAEFGRRPDAAVPYAPPSLTLLGGFAAITLGQGEQYSDDGTEMF